MAAVAGALVAHLDAETASFNRKMGQAAERVRSSGARMNRALARVDKAIGRATRSMKAFAKRNLSLRNAVVTLVGGAGLGLLIKRSIDAGDAIAKTADAIGISTKALQEYRFALDISGVAQEQTDKGLKKFVRNMGELARSSSETQTALKDLDPALLQNLRSLESVEAQLALGFRALASYTTQQKRAAVGQALFGRTAIEMTVAIKGGIAPFEALIRRTGELGLVLRDELTRAAERAKDQLAILGKTISTNVTRAVLEHADAIAEMAQRFTEAIPKIVDMIDKLGQWIGLIEQAPIDRLKDINDRIRELRESLASPLVRLEDFLGGGKAQRRMQILNALLRERLLLTSDLAIAELAVARAAKTPVIAPAAGGAKPVDPFAGRGVPKRRPRVTIDLVRPAAREAAEAIAKLRAETLKGTDAFKKMQDAAAAVFTDTRTPMENFRARIVELNALRERSAITEDTYARAVARAQDAMVAQNEIAQAGTRIFDNFGDGIIAAMQRGENAMASFRNAAVAALFDVQRELIKTLVFEPFKKFAVSAIAGLFGGATGPPVNLLAGIRPAAHGARNTPAGQPFLVGEGGRPEVVIPPGGSTIVPHGGLGGITIVQHINVHPDVSSVARAQVLSMMPVIQDAAAAGVADARRRDPKFFR